MTLEAQLLEEKTRINWWGVCNAVYCDYPESPISIIMLLILSGMSCGGVLISKSQDYCIHVIDRPQYVSSPAARFGLSKRSLLSVVMGPNLA